MIDRVTEAMIAVEGESFRDKAWVVCEEAPRGHWAIGGSVIGADSGDDQSIAHFTVERGSRRRAP